MGRRGLVGLFTTHGAKGGGFESPCRLSLLKNVSFEEKKMKKKEEEEEEELECVKREERGRRRRHSNQERLQERPSVRFKEND